LTKTENEYVYIVAHLYQNHVTACARTNIALEVLARQFKHVHFVRIRSTDAIQTYSDKGLPTLLVYRGGKLVHSFICLAELIPKQITEVTLAKFLALHNILREPTGADISSQSPRGQNKSTTSTKTAARSE